MPESLHQPAASTFRTFTGLLRRRWYVVPLALLVPLAALAFSLSQEEKYSAAASVLFLDSGTASVLASSDPEREAATNVQLLSLEAIKKRVERSLGGPRATAEDVGVKQEGASNLLEVSAHDPEPKVAARTANAYADQYVALRRRSELQDLLADRKFLTDELARVRRADPTQAAALRRQLRRLDFQLSRPSSSARVVSRAELPSSPSSPKPVRNTIIGGIVGLFLAGIVALLVERLDPRLKRPNEAEAIFDRPLLGIVRKSRALAHPVTGKMPTRDFDNFVALRSYLRYMRPHGDLRSVLVTSGVPGDGKTTVAWNLACAAANPGRRVLLVEADVRAPSLAAALNVTPETGLSDVLAGNADVREVIREVAVESSKNGNSPARVVSVVFAGLPSANVDPLNWERLGASLADAEREFDLIVVDTAPMVSVPDAIPLLSHIGGVIVIGRIGNTPRAALARLKEQLEAVDARVVGVVVNSVGKDTESGYGYGYGYGNVAERG